jgi:CRISPR-associated protein Cmr6
VSLPLPGSMAEFLAFSRDEWQNRVNRSLLFDRGMDQYKPSWQIPTGGKEIFLSQFTREFQVSPPNDFQAVVHRREQALRALGARSVQRFARSRLVVGLGLPHPTETGFLFDRITGCPYLPGSSVKGLLRAAARLAAAGELAVAGDAWTEEDVRRIFGPELGGGFTPQTGSVVFYDAFPAEWPRLEVDILTPHHRDHNDKNGPPADWDEPNPVPFLTVAPGAAFCFRLGPGDPASFEKDFPRLAVLLDVALDLLGLGAKKAAGYGVFGEKAPAAPAPVPPRNDPPGPPPSSASTVKEVAWTGVELVLHKGSPAVSRGGKLTPFSREALPVEAWEALKKQKKIRADIVIIKTSDGGFRLDRIQSWREK